MKEYFNFMKENKQILFYIWLAQCFPYGSVKPKQIVLNFNGDVKSFYENLDNNFKKFDLTEKRIQKLKITKPNDFNYIISLCEKLKIKIVCFSDKNYPKKLKAIDSSPIVLYYIGNLEAANNPSVAIVGTRRASTYGLTTAKKIASSLAMHNITIISGCAEGIDSSAHTGAVEMKKPTISVLGTSIERPYPAGSTNLKRQIIQNKGLIVSEYAPSTEVFPWLFPIRNRLIVGLSDKVIVVESPEKSGAMITASLACDFGKELFCVPPSDLFNNNNNGIKKCLKEGATLLLDTNDVLNSFKFSNFSITSKSFANTKEKVKLKTSSVPDNLKPLFNLIDNNFDIDKAAFNLKLPINRVLEMLTQLEILNLIKKTGTYYHKF